MSSNTTSRVSTLDTVTDTTVTVKDDNVTLLFLGVGLWVAVVSEEGKCVVGKGEIFVCAIVTEMCEFLVYTSVSGSNDDGKVFV